MDIAALKEAAEKATPGEWHEGDKWVFVPPVDAENNPHHALRNVLSGVPEAQENCAYIALANPTAILSLIERVGALEEAARAAHAKITAAEIESNEGGVIRLLDAAGDILFAALSPTNTQADE